MYSFNLICISLSYLVSSRTTKQNGNGKHNLQIRVHLAEVSSYADLALSSLG